MKTGLALILILPGMLWFNGLQDSPPASIPKASSPFRIKVEAVNVLVTVVDREGRFLTDLPPNRFAVSEDGVPQEISGFSTETSLPLTIALLVDSSSSVRKKLRFEKKAAASFFRSVLRPADQAIVVEFDAESHLLQDFTSRAGLLIQAMTTIEPGGGTALFDAIYRVSEKKLKAVNSRRAFVVISDGEDLHSRRTISEAMEAAQRAEATIYAIGTSNFGERVEDHGEEELKFLASQTGGRVFLPQSEAQLQEAFALINEELRSQYSLVYRSTNKQADGHFRTIKIHIKDGDGLSVRCKTGYWASPGN